MYTVSKNLAEQLEKMTLHAQSMGNNDSARIVCTLQSAYSRTLKHYTSSHQTPPPLSLILYSLYLILYDLNVYYTQGGYICTGEVKCLFLAILIKVPQH